MFQSLRENGSIAYIPYVCAGDVDMEFTHELVRRLSDAGADAIEIGMPFSDPVADGPVIQAAMSRSLSKGFSPTDLFGLVSSLRSSGMRTPIVVMSYANPVLKFGIEEFCRQLAHSGGDAVLPVDLPPEESCLLEEAASGSGLDLIRLIAPSTSDDRLRRILSSASGFVYAVSVSGVTGPRDELPPTAEPLLRRALSLTSLPVVLGFGISRPSHVRSALSNGASGVVEGSALIASYSSELGDRKAALRSVEEHAREMKAATRRHA